MSKPVFNMLGEIVADDSMRWFDSDIVPAMVIGWLKNQKGADVEININSPGGDVTAGLAIANAIKAYEGHVTANVLGIAASMASVIACACDEVNMGDGAFMMIHNPCGISIGEADDLRHEADVLDKMRDSILGFYQTKTTKTADELKALMDAETWMTFDDMSANGFTVGRYAEEFKAAACATHRAFANAPEAARRFFSAIPGDWQKRFSGLQAAKDKEIAALKAEIASLGDKNAELQKKGVELLAAAEDQHKVAVQKFESDIKERDGALAAAKAECEQLRAELDKTTKALSDTKAALDAETERYRAQVGGALQQPDGEGAFRAFPDAVKKLGYAEAARKYPELLDAYNRSHAKKK